MFETKKQLRLPLVSNNSCHDIAWCWICYSFVL